MTSFESEPLDPATTEDLPTPVTHPATSKRSALLGAVLGMTALAGTIVGVGAIAGAQDDPTDTIEPAAAEPIEADGGDEGVAIALSDGDFAAFDECMAEQLGDLWMTPEILELEELDLDADDVMFFAEGDEGEMVFDGDVENGEFAEPTPEEIAAWEAEEAQFVAAEEACNDLLPEEVKAEIAAWQPYEECIDGQIGSIEDPWLSIEEPTAADFDAHDAALQAADEACRDLLPADVQQEMAAWDAFDQCLSDAGLFDEDGFAMSAVHIETGDGFQIAEFGDVEGSVTISGTAGNLEVVSSGGVTVLDEAALDAQWEALDAEWEAAHQACEDQLPEDLLDGMFFDDGFEIEEGEAFDSDEGEDADG